MLSNATHVDDLEFMIAIDDDDQESIDFFQSPEWAEFKEPHRGTSFQVQLSQRYGYLGIFRYYNDLAAAAKGDQLIVWNDDAEMHTKGWDTIVSEQAGWFGLLRMQCPNHPHPFALFPIVPRAWFDLMGAVSLVTHVDWWIYNICEPTGRMMNIPVTVSHNRADITGENNDETSADNSYEFDGKNPNHLDDYSHPQRRADLEEWKLRLQMYGFPHTKPEQFPTINPTGV